MAVAEPPDFSCLPKLDLCILLSFPSLGGCHVMRHRCRPPPNDSRNWSRFISEIRGLETPHDDGSSTSRTKPSLEHHSPSPRPSVPCCAKRNGYKGSNHLSQPWVCWTSGPDHLVQAVVILKLIKLERKRGRASHSCHTSPDRRTHFSSLMAMHIPSQASLASFNSHRMGLSDADAPDSVSWPKWLTLSLCCSFLIWLAHPRQSQPSSNNGPTRPPFNKLWVVIGSLEAAC